MVDVNTQNKTISVNVSSSGVSSNVNASGDTTLYYSNKAREWAISNRIVDGVDYSSKYYAGMANQSALNAQSFAQSAQDSYNNFQQSVDSALSDIDSSVQGAIDEINNTKTNIITDIEFVADGEKEEIQELADKAKDDIESTGFYMRDDKLYFINSKGEEEEFKTNDNELNNPFSLLDYKYSEYELNNLSWLRSNGQYNSKDVYPSVYDLLLKIYNGTETKAGVSVKLTTETFTDYDFVLNTADETFRLPIKVKLASGKAVVGNGMVLGLTNEADDCVSVLSVGSTTDNKMYMGYFRKSNYPEGFLATKNLNTDGSVFSGSNHFGVTTDPNYSGIETSDSDLYLYFYVGETVQNANLINAGRIEEKIANINAYAVQKNNQSDIDTVIEWSIPDYSAATTITFTQGKSYTVPYDCEIFVSDYNTGGGFTLKLNNSSGPIVMRAGSNATVISSDRARFKKGTVLYPSQVTTQGSQAHYIIPLIGVN